MISFISMSLLYPKFKTLDIEDKPIIENYTTKHPPYCDFNFANIYNWSSKKNPTSFSILNDNLVIRMKDFIDEFEIVSFLGTHKTYDTVKTLLSDFKWLSMIPEICITDELKACDELIIEEDVNNNDYIISLEEVAGLSGSSYKAKRKRVNRFLEKYPLHKVKLISLQDPKVMEEIKQIFYEWAKYKHISDFSDELNSIMRFAATSHLYSLVVIGVYINNKLIGFTTNELSRDKIVIGGFGKGIYEYEGIYPFLENVTARYLLSIGYEYLNYEQDLGLEGLRQSKLSWKPVKFFKKYIIRLK